MGYEIFTPKDALAVFDAVCGQDRNTIFGAQPHALDMLRIKGADFANYGILRPTDPFEAGIATVPQSKGDDFIGKAALIEREHPRHRLVLEIDGE
jgi:glycine cleavage system aminomethyltransferase T